jgi:hypothetical protein
MESSRVASGLLPRPGRARLESDREKRQEQSEGATKPEAAEVGGKATAVRVLDCWW